MKTLIHSISVVLFTSLIGVTGLAVPQNLLADSDDHRERKKRSHETNRDHDKHTYTKDRKHNNRSGDKHDRHDNRSRVIHHGHQYVLPERRVRHYRDRRIVRPHGRWYYGYGHHHADHDAFKWLAFTVITLSVLDNLNESQQRAHEDAQIRATSAPIGERIIWDNNNVSGSVTATREGTSTSGRYCREFQQEINVGGRIEQAYGTACRQSDGSWEVISTGAQ